MSLRPPVAARRAKHLSDSCQARLAKIFFFPKYRNYDLTKSSRASQEGRFAIATTRGAGCDGRVVPQGSRSRVRSSRVVLAPRCWGQV